jgi:hypothetical protein
LGAHHVQLREKELTSDVLDVVQRESATLPQVKRRFGDMDLNFYTAGCFLLVALLIKGVAFGAQRDGNISFARACTKLSKLTAVLSIPTYIILEFILKY